MPVIDRTGDNAKCYKCEKVVGKEIVSYNNVWLCKKCRKKVEKRQEEISIHKEDIKRKLKKKGRTAKVYVKDKLEGNPGVDFSIDEIAAELIEECLTKKDSIDDAKKTASIIISGLRKEAFPIEKTGRGIYRWRSRSGLTKEEEDREELKKAENLVFGDLE